MGFRFRRSIKLGKYFRINVSKSGIGYSIGGKGYRHTVSPNGRTRDTFSIPGTGISYTTSKSHKNEITHSKNYPENIQPVYPKKAWEYKNDLMLYAILGVIFLISSIASVLLSYALLIYEFLFSALLFFVIGIILIASSISARKKAINANISEQSDFSNSVCEEISEISPKEEERDIVERDASNNTTIKQQTDAPVLKQNTYIPPHKVVAEPPVILEANQNHNKLYDILFPDEGGEYALAYKYTKDFCFIDTSAADISGYGGEFIEFLKDPDNFDNQAIAIYLNSKKVGYVHKDGVRNMIHDWIDRGDPIRAHINTIDVENNKATYKIGFYRSVDCYEYKIFRLQRVNKRIDEYSIRADHLEYCDEGEYVTINYDYDHERWYVYNSTGNEIGEFGKAFEDYYATQKYRLTFGKIKSVSRNKDGNLECDIYVYMV